MSSSAEVFCDWSPADRRLAELEIATQRMRSTFPALRSATETSHLDQETLPSRPSASPLSLERPQMVIVDVSDGNGRTRSIEMRPGDDPEEKAKQFAMSTPSGLTAKQISKLVQVLRQTLETHFAS